MRFGRVIWAWLRRPFGFLLLLLGLLCAPFSAQAKIIEADSLLLKVLAYYQNTFQGYFEIETRVFDPEAFIALDEEMPETVIPHEQTDKGFRQRVIWVRDEYLLIETLDWDERPLHIYIHEPVERRYTENLGQERLFSAEDVAFPPIYFFTKHIDYLKTVLQGWGICPETVGIRFLGESFVYQLGGDHAHILVDPETFRVLEIQREVQIRGRFFPMRIAFSDWDQDLKELPITTRCYINGRLFKTITVTEIRRRILVLRDRFLLDYQDRLPPFHPFSPRVDYGR
jgi:hypothetical protein